MKIPARMSQASQTDTQVTPLRPPSRWHDPLKLIENETPGQASRVVLWSICVLVSILLIWAAFGKLDIVATAEGTLSSQTLLKVVQPAEAGIVKQLLVAEGDQVKAGQLLARLDTTLAQAEHGGQRNAMDTAQMQVRRIEAGLRNTPMQKRAGDDSLLFAQVQSQDIAQRRAFHDSEEQAQSLLLKAEYERKSALQVLAKLEQTLPTFEEAADSYARLEQNGFLSKLASHDKRREAIERRRDLEAQRATVDALHATIAAQQQKLSQLRSSYRSELEKELADLRNRITQLAPGLTRSAYQEGLMDLRAPQNGVVKELATTTVGAVVQAGAVVMTLVPQGEQLYADVAIKNEDVGFVHVGQQAQVKLSAYPFQKYGMLKAKVMRISADASDSGRPSSSLLAESSPAQATGISVYRARIALDRQNLGGKLALAPGMQLTAEIHLGKRTVLEYLLSPLQQTVQEAARER
ncbi:HlyD family type I secretion periplasmic adaptor subunit [Chitinimonas arctica]|uniref:Membrane fusion protein (MFP) family protein n=1 Tax=Chitinimonas arctica TaxID=2594795 RepID=A0A516SKD2_9NEIS|nr:HlyD family type I secretion periplasmic adaptor subunit [Chitinimonas arctica]QDQ28478.1 HlyD family type I secretion periplasmic adaptor subunit [Chitinimonas arctica]